MSLLVTCGSTSCGPTQKRGEAVSIWAASDSRKVKRDEPVGGASGIWSREKKTVTLEGARNEYLAFQLIVHANSDLEAVDSSVSDLRSGSARIDRENIALFREHYLHVTDPSSSMYGDPPSAGEGWYPDQLVPMDAPKGGAPFSVAAGQNQGIWVDVFIPDGTTAGVYKGKVSVSAKGQPKTDIGLEVQVWDFTLPTETHLKTWFYFGPDELANGHHVKKYDARYKRLEPEYYRMARAHRINIDAPAYFNYSGTGSGVKIDWSSHDSRAIPLFDGTLFKDGIGLDPICLPIDREFPYYGDHGGLESQEFAETLKSMLVLVKEHFDARGWTDRAFIWGLDEPADREEYEQVRRYGQIIHDSGTGIPLMITEQPSPEDPSWGSLIGYVDIWCPAVGSYIPSQMDERRAAGERTWTYNGGKPYAGSQVIDTDGLGMRTWAWLAYKYNVECWLYWHCMYWKDIYNNPEADNDVWNDPVTYDQRRKGNGGEDWGNGDGTLFYPGYDVGVDGPVSSQRMKVLRRGLQDYEYMWLLGEQGKADTAERIVNSVVRYGLGDADGRKVGWSTNPDDWDAAREEMAKQIAGGP